MTSLPPLPLIVSWPCRRRCGRSRRAGDAVVRASGRAGRARAVAVDGVVVVAAVDRVGAAEAADRVVAGEAGDGVVVRRAESVSFPAVPVMTLRGPRSQ